MTDIDANKDVFDIDQSQAPRISRVDLGDAIGDDDKLRQFLVQLGEQVNHDAPETATRKKYDLLGLIKSPVRWTLDTSYRAFAYVRERFMDHEIRRAQAKRIDSEASLNRARAESERKTGRAEAELRLAQAQAIRTDAQLKLIRELSERGIDWQAEATDSGQINIVVTKRLESD